MNDRERFGYLLGALTADFISLDSEQVDALFAHYELLRKWNRVLNLTRIERLEEAVERHYAESLFLASRLGSAATMVDIGSGAGFPGIPVAVAGSSRKVTLVESDARKSAFLREARDYAPNCEVRTVRAESLTDSFDAVVSRAVRPQDVVKVARRVGSEIFLLISQADADALNIPSAAIIPLPFSRGGVLWHARVPRGT